MGIRTEKFGITKDGRMAHLYTVTKDNGMEMALTDFGAILVRLFVPDKKGQRTDVVLGYDSLAEYEENGCFFGATIGRNANRIAGAAFTLDGTTYHLSANENKNNLHSDRENGFHKVLWETELLEQEDAVKFSYLSADGENGFPGTLRVSVTYKLLDEDAIEISYQGVSDKKTVINLTNHSYFNLKGHDAGNICDAKIKILASGFTELSEGGIPTGQILPVEGTPMDLRSLRRIGDTIDADWEQLRLTGGYDHNFALDTTFGKVEKIAEVVDEQAELTMEVWSDLPGVQFYAGNAIVPQTGKGGARYEKRQGLCLETQYFPNHVNEPNFQKAIFDKGEVYQTKTLYKFCRSNQL